MDGYVTHADEPGLSVSVGQDDGYIPLALGHGVMVIADIVLLMLDHFRLARPDVRNQVSELVKTFAEWAATNTGPEAEGAA
jgi:hypothetical protein